MVSSSPRLPAHARWHDGRHPCQRNYVLCAERRLYECFARLPRFRVLRKARKSAWGWAPHFGGAPILRRELPAVIDMRTLQAFAECSVHTTVDDRLNLLTARHADAALTWRSVDVRRPLCHAARSNAPR